VLQGLLIDYDKDPVSKRNRSYEMELQSIRVQQDERDSLRYYCSKCRTRCLTLHKVRNPPFIVGSSELMNVVTGESVARHASTVNGQRILCERGKVLEILERRQRFGAAHAMR
jgi:hypothetical protein